MQSEDKKLFDALQNYDLEGLKSVLESGTQPNITKKDGERPNCPALHYAVERRLAQQGKKAEIALEMISELIRAGADVSGQWGEGSQLTPLVTAAVEGDSEVVNILLDHGADPDLMVLFPESYVIPGLTPRLMAMREGHADVVEMMQKKKPLPDLPSDPSERVIGHWVLVAYEYPSEDMGNPHAPWYDEESDVGGHLKFDREGQFKGVEFTGEPCHGGFKVEEDRIVLLHADTEEEMEAFIDPCGHILTVNLTDEQTGYRGEAVFYYVRSGVLRGFPDPLAFRNSSSERV